MCVLCFRRRWCKAYPPGGSEGATPAVGQSGDDGLAAAQPHQRRPGAGGHHDQHFPHRGILHRHFRGCLLRVDYFCDLCILAARSGYFTGQIAATESTIHNLHIFKKRKYCPFK